MDYNIKLIITFITSLILSFLFIKIYLRKKRIVNNKLREELIHNKNKASTPVGGFLFIASTFTSLLIIDYKIFFDKRVFPLIFLALIYFILGFIDDYKKRKSYKGLSAMIRMLVEVISAFIFLNFIDINEYIFHLPNNSFIYIGSILILLIPLIIFATTNAINLTDGMDGLLSFLFTIAYLPFLLMALLKKEQNLALFMISLYGSLLAFLCFNIHPASIFMGDQGSLFLGAVFSSSAFILNLEYLLPISGLLFVFETLSVIIQVSYFHLFKKRVFLMSPIHHHYEMKGVKEWKVVYGFILIQLIMLIISLMLIL